MAEGGKQNVLGIAPKSTRPPRPWNVTFVCFVGLIHAILSVVATVGGLVLQRNLHLQDPVLPLVHAAFLSSVWGFLGILVVLPFVWVLTLKGSRHARTVLVLSLVFRALFAWYFLHLADVSNDRLIIATIVAVDVIGLFLLFGGHRTSAYFAKQSDAPVRPPGDYGLDAPYVPIISCAAGIAFLVYSAFLSPEGMALMTLCGMLLVMQGCVFLYTSQRGKFILMREILADAGPAQRVLDVGCGRGMGAIMALQTSADALVAGIDIWRKRDQSGNDPHATLQNAQEANVADRLDLATADMSRLPFADASFDLVISTIAIQNIKDRATRDQAIAEIYRVTAPGGRIRIVDIQYVAQYRDQLQALGALDVQVSNCGIRGWFGNPFFASRLLAATKPG